MSGDATYCDKLLASFDPYNDWHDHVEGKAIPTPEFCPVCNVEAITLCPDYGFLITGSVSERQIERRMRHPDLKRTFANIAERQKHDPGDWPNGGIRIAR